ncbi:MAG: RCC1 domain-containing protein [Planctomycetota bacterium]
MAAGAGHSLALQADGQVQAWGDNSSGQCDVPPLPAGLTYVEVAAGGPGFSASSGLGQPSHGYSLARLSDGSVVAWGSNWGGQIDVPALPPGLTYTGLAAGPGHALALRSDGSLVAWGDDTCGQCNVPALPAGVTYVEASAGGPAWSYEDWDGCYGNSSGVCGRSVALRSDGSVVTWGLPLQGTPDVPALPAGLTYVEVSAGADHMAARRSDGSVVAWGANDAGQCDVPPLPAGLTYAGVSAGMNNTTAWLSDGSLVEWGSPLAFASGLFSAPPLPPGVSYVELAAGGGSHLHSIYGGDPFCTGSPQVVFNQWQVDWQHVVALRSDGSVVTWGDNSVFQVFDPWTDLGGGTTGLSGMPELSGIGMPIEGQSVGLALYPTPPGALTLLWIALDSTPFPALGGTVHANPPVTEFLLSAGAGGYLFVETTWPPGVVSGAEFWFQFLVQDPSVAPGITLSNGLKMQVP